jgi:hypothetical protein
MGIVPIWRPEARIRSVRAAKHVFLGSFGSGVIIFERFPSMRQPDQGGAIPVAPHRTARWAIQGVQIGMPTSCQDFSGAIGKEA